MDIILKKQNEFYVLTFNDTNKYRQENFHSSKLFNCSVTLFKKMLKNFNGIYITINDFHNYCYEIRFYHKKDAINFIKQKIEPIIVSEMLLGFKHTIKTD